jgi:hypothetical protein
MRRGVTEAWTKWRGLVSEKSHSSAARQQEQNAPRLFAQLDDGSIAAQFSFEASSSKTLRRQAHGVLPGMPIGTLLWAGGNCSTVGSS